MAMTTSRHVQHVQHEGYWAVSKLFQQFLRLDTVQMCMLQREYQPPAGHRQHATKVSHVTFATLCVRMNRLQVKSFWTCPSHAPS